MRKGKDPKPVLDPYLWLTDPDADRQAQKHTDPMDPDPEHWLKYFQHGNTVVYLVDLYLQK
jgi:hypothetical protein